MTKKSDTLFQNLIEESKQTWLCEFKEKTNNKIIKFALDRNLGGEFVNTVTEIVVGAYDLGFDCGVAACMGTLKDMAEIAGNNKQE